jgi:hypothetical protein
VTILLGTVDLPDGELVIIDPGLANFWRHAGNPASPLRRDPPCVDLLISGADAKVTGTTWDREFNPLAIYDAPKPDTLIAQFADFTKRHGFDASASECGCNMHGRRYFTKALDAGDARASLPLAAFKKLYDVEEEVRGRAPAIVLEARQQKSRPVYDELLDWARVYKPQEPPSSMMGKALQYLTNHEVALTRFLDDGRIPIDNGVVEL